MITARAKHTAIDTGLVVVGLALVALVGPREAAQNPRSVGVAQETPAPGDAALLSGAFVLAEPRATAQQRVDQAIETAVAGMSFFLRDFGRGRLRDKNPVHTRLEIEITSPRVVVTYDDERYEGTEGTWREVTARGEPARLLVQRTGRRLYLTFRGDDGEKRMVHTVSEDGRYLWLDVAVSSPRLPTPLTYRLDFRRAG